MWLTLISTAVAAFALEARDSRRPNEQQTEPSRLPPPVAQIYDPVPGPYVVHLDEKGKSSDDRQGLIANAIKNWSGPTLQAFTICFRPANERIDWTVVFTALEAVSRDLKAQGARVVVMPSGGICAPSSPVAGERGARVEIMGVVRI